VECKQNTNSNPREARLEWGTNFAVDYVGRNDIKVRCIPHWQPQRNGCGDCRLKEYLPLFAESRPRGRFVLWLHTTAEAKGFCFFYNSHPPRGHDSTIVRPGLAGGGGGWEKPGCITQQITAVHHLNLNDDICAQPPHQTSNHLGTLRG